MTYLQLYLLRTSGTLVPPKVGTGDTLQERHPSFPAVCDPFPSCSHNIYCHCLGLLLYSTSPLACVYGLVVPGPVVLQINNLQHTQRFSRQPLNCTSTNYSEGKTILTTAEAFPLHHPEARYQLFPDACLQSSVKNCLDL